MKATTMVRLRVRRTIRNIQKGVPEDCHYSDHENFYYANETTPQISETELLKKLMEDFAWFAENKPAHAAAI